MDIELLLEVTWVKLSRNKGKSERRIKERAKGKKDQGTSKGKNKNKGRRIKERAKGKK